MLSIQVLQKVIGLLGGVKTDTAQKLLSFVSPGVYLDVQSDPLLGMALYILVSA